MHVRYFQRRGPFVRYGIAVGAVAVAVLVRRVLVLLTGMRHEQFVTLFPAILVAAVLAGRGAAIVASLLGALAAVYFFGATPRTLVDAGLMVLTGVLAGWLIQRLSEALWSADARAAELAESEFFYRQTLDSIPGLVFTTRPDGRCDYVSQQFEEYTGIRSADMLGDRWTEMLHPEDRERVFAAWSAAVADGASYDVEYRLRRRDGLYEWFKARGHPIRKGHGQIVRWFGVVINIDLFRRAHEELMATRDRLEGQKKELENIIGIVSHDLRAPLINIRGFNQELKQDCTRACALLGESEMAEGARVQLNAILAESAPEALNIVEMSARTMHRLIESLVKVARAGLAEPKPEALEMQELVQEILSGLKVRIARSGAHVETGALPACYADRVHAAQVFTNLVDNALKYLDPVRPGEIRIDGMVEGGQSVYRVSDNGVGIAPEHREKVFDMFYQVDGGARGEGIGLSVVKRMVERNGGQIRLTSEEGRGTTFFVTLPRPRGDYEAVREVERAGRGV